MKKPKSLKKSQKIKCRPKSIDDDTEFFEIDLTQNCIWDEDLGTVITRKGMWQFIEEVHKRIREGWKWVSTAMHSTDGNVFVLRMSQKSENVKLPPDWGKVV